MLARRLQDSPGSLPVAKAAAGVLTGAVDGRSMLNLPLGIILATLNKGPLSVHHTTLSMTSMAPICLQSGDPVVSVRMSVAQRTSNSQ